ncbi:MAG: DNA ligase [Elusimicrobia bacterium]|nr:DNA ligase [Elusimicrobiota bacterium]
MPKFVIQKHRSKTLHYDFRLEIGDVLKSWAVPRGPSLNPKEKRLAVEVDDHALSYMHFEGEIPQGSYGAGEVIVWDRGDYSCAGEGTAQEQYEKGSLLFELRGKKLKGGFRLLRMKWEEKPVKWLLVKQDDEHASPVDVTKTMPGSVLSMRRLD